MPPTLSKPLSPHLPTPTFKMREQILSILGKASSIIDVLRESQ